MEKLISVVTVGGTFDVLHKGHWFLLEEAFNVAERVLIGLTTDRFVIRMGKSPPVDVYGGRREELESWSALAIDFFAEARQRRGELESKPATIRQILGDGAAKARKKAAEVLLRVQEACGIRG